MTILDLFFILVLLAATISVITAIVAAVRGQKARALTVLRRVGLCLASYLTIVYLVTAISTRVVLRVGDPECNDEWCLAVESVQRSSGAAVAVYDLKLRIFSRARARAQRENIATDVYLVDSHWRRFNSIPDGAAIPLNTLLQPGESVFTSRKFEIPLTAHDVALKVGRGAGPAGPPICWIIGRCEAFHKGTIIRID